MSDLLLLPQSISQDIYAHKNEESTQIPMKHENDERRSTLGSTVRFTAADGLLSDSILSLNLNTK